MNVSINWDQQRERWFQIKNELSRKNFPFQSYNANHKQFRRVLPESQITVLNTYMYIIIYNFYGCTFIIFLAFQSILFSISWGLFLLRLVEGRHDRDSYQIFFSKNIRRLSDIGVNCIAFFFHVHGRLNWKWVFNETLIAEKYFKYFK